MKKTYLFLLAAMTLTLAACTPFGNSTPQEMTDFGINKKSIGIEVGESFQLRVWYEPEEAEDLAPEVIWESSKEKVASVSSSGKVEAKEEGTTIITATCGKFTAECEVEVIPAPVYSLTISPTSIDCSYAGGTFTISVTTEDAAEWTVESSESWAQVSTNEGSGSMDLTVTIESTKEKKETIADITFTCSGKTYTIPVTRDAYIEGFSVSSSKKVVFAPGNLQYKASTKTWEFQREHYVKLGEDNSKISPTNSAWIDLFGWGTGNNPTLASTEVSDYGTFTDWGINAIGCFDWDADAKERKPNVWRTLSDDEWRYMFQERPNADKLRGQATVNNVPGYMFLPDEWELPSGISFTPDPNNFTTNKYDVGEYRLMKKNGAVFLPAAGFRNGTTVSGVGTEGHYYDSTPRNGNTERGQDGDGLGFGFTSKSAGMKTYRPYYGRSVRLVRDVN